MSDWRSYDPIAPRYDEVWGHRFEAVARHLWELMPPAPGAVVLDIGTGTGIVPRALGARLERLAGVVACDRAVGMLAMASTRMAALRVTVAEAAALPFPPAVFDAATASFVLSHLPDPRAGLAEAYRVLKPAGVFGMTSWTASTDPYSEAWGALLAEAVSRDQLDEALAQVAPSENFLATADNVESSLTRAGFLDVEVRTLALEFSVSLDLFVSDRALSAPGRFARHALGSEAWNRFNTRARELLSRSFGARLDCARGVLIGLGHKLPGR